MNDRPDGIDAAGSDTLPAGSHRGRSRLKVVATVVGIVLAGVLAAVLLVAFTPLLDHPVESSPDPAGSYEAGLARTAELQDRDDGSVNPVCRSRVIDQERRSARAVVLLHGFTNCPRQFDEIAQAYADAGYSVVVPRLPGHGKSDRLTREPSDVTPQSLADAADEAVDIAAGLGADVEVVGLSGGGTLAAWLAHQRQEVTSAALIAPLVIPAVMPEFAVAPVARLSRVVPDIYLWWDSSQKERLASPPYAYPRYSLRSLGAFLTVGLAVQHDAAGRTGPLERLIVVTNANDTAVSAAGVRAIADALDPLARARVDHQFPASDGFRHDLVDPRGENADNLSQIYPTLGQLLALPDLAAPDAP